MQVMDRMNDVRDTWRERRLRSRNEDLDQENRMMRSTMRTLQEELEHEREARSEILRAMQGMKPETIKVKRRGGLLRLIVVGGTAYVIGAKAGRERYEEIRAWWDRLRSRDARTDGTDPSTGDVAARAGADEDVDAGAVGSLDRGCNDAQAVFQGANFPGLGHSESFRGSLDRWGSATDRSIEKCPSSRPCYRSSHHAERRGLFSSNPIDRLLVRTSRSLG